MQAADIRPVPPEQRTQSAFDLFVIFAGANIVATTMQVGASLSPMLPTWAALAVIAVGAVVGSLLVAALAPLGPRLGVPSIIAARAALGIRGGGIVAGVLYLTNFAWIAVNNVIAASVAAQIWGSPETLNWWILVLGLWSTSVVAGGPNAVKVADRVAVPLLVVVGAVVTYGVWRTPPPPGPVLSAAPAALPWARSLDIVIGYQVSWILMFADYSRYTKSGRGSFAAVWLALAMTSMWLMPLGFAAARAAGSVDPGAMLNAVQVGWWGAMLMVFATLTTNFVNIYLSSLAWRSVFPKTTQQSAIWSIGIIGTVLGIVGGAWLDRYVDLMLVLGGLLVPVGGVLLAHYFFARRPVAVPDLYDAKGPYSRASGFLVPGLAAWATGTAAYWIGGPHGGGSIPALVVSVVVYLAALRLGGRRAP
jgi:NCS1 family nucleobase:cation symporter-1